MHRVKLEDRIDMLAGVRTPEEAFQLKYDYCKKLKDKLNELQDIIQKITEINGVSSKDKSLINEIPELKELYQYQPVLPFSAKPNEITIPIGKKKKYYFLKKFLKIQKKLKNFKFFLIFF